MKSGIYFITNTLANKIYVGSSINIPFRWNKHKSELNNNKHGNRHLQRAWNKYGESAFKFHTVLFVKIDELLDIEQQYLDKIKLIPDKYYNILTSARHTRLGTKHTPEAIAKMRLAQAGRLVSDETRKKISAAKIGKPSPMLGKIHSLEARKKMSDSNIYKGKRGPRLGKKHSLDTITKLSEFNKCKDVHSFKNEITNQVFQGTAFDFRKTYSLNQGNLSSVILGKRRAVSNWILEKHYDT